ncbi:MAG: hypothetical protein J6D21_01570 [Clostridia bacterium]|nr:hypothetical protein [Clostridia bacterium]
MNLYEIIYDLFLYLYPLEIAAANESIIIFLAMTVTALVVFVPVIWLFTLPFRSRRR